MLSAGILMISRNKYLAIAFPALFYILSNLSEGGAMLLGRLEIIFPNATFVLDSMTNLGLLKDHLLIISMGVILFYIGLKKWKKAGA